MTQPTKSKPNLRKNRFLGLLSSRRFRTLVFVLFLLAIISLVAFVRKTIFQPLLDSPEITLIGLGLGLALTAFLLICSILCSFQLRQEVHKKTQELLEELDERRRVEESLRASEGRLRAVFEAARGIGFILMDVKQKPPIILDISPAVEEILGYSRAEIVGKPASELKVHLFDLSIEPLLTDLKSEKYSQNIEINLLRKNGEIFPSLSSIYPMCDAEGDITALVAVMIDLSAQKEIEQNLRESQELFEIFTDQMPGLAFIKDANSNLLYANRYMRENYGADRWIGKRDDEFFPPETARQILLIDQAALQSETGFIGEEVTQDLSGTTHIWRSYKFPIRRAGKPTLIGAISIDMTNMRQVSEDLRISQERLDLAIRGSDLGLWDWDVQSDKITINERWATMLGYSPDEIDPLLSHRKNLIHAEDASRVMDAWMDHFSGRSETYRVEYRIRTKKSEWCWVLDRGKVVERDVDGKPLRAAGTQQDISDRKLAEENSLRQMERMAGLRAVDEAISASIDLHLTLQILLDQVRNQLDIDATDILLFDPQVMTLELYAARGFITGFSESQRMKIGKSTAGEAVLKRKAILQSPILNPPDLRWNSEKLAAEGFTAYGVFPLIAKGVVKGVLEIYSKTPFQKDEDWYNFLEILAAQAAIAIENSSLFEHMQRVNINITLAYDAIIEGWGHALELRENEVKGHSQRVTDLTVRLARFLGIKDVEIIHMRRGALLHDIGKMGISDAILFKSDELTPVEMVEMKKHPVFAFELLKGIELLRPAVNIPYCHHERWDGGGYPRNLQGEDIPQGARIFSIVDVFDSLTHPKPFRPAWTDQQALNSIREQAGKQFDPQIAESFFEMMTGEGFWE